MSNKILSIKEKVPTITTLPNGIYTGVWGGYIIDVRFNDKSYELTTEDGVRGIGIKVIVTIEDGVATFNELKN